MHAFDYITVLLSFVFAAAITHVLATAGDIIIAWKRVRPSALNALWMLVSLMPVIAWWISFWDLRAEKVWDMGTVAFFFAMACVLYLVVRLSCPRVPAAGPVDLVLFHQEEGRKYTGAFAAAAAVSFISNIAYAQEAGAWFTQNMAVGPMVLSAAAAAIFTQNRWVQWLAVAVQAATWTWYYTSLQSALVG